MSDSGSSKERNQKAQSPSSGPNILAIILGLLLAGAIGYIIYNQLKGPAVALQAQVDELTGKIAALQTQKDSLIEANNFFLENSDSMEGTFYEVQIGAFEDFNLDKYMTDFAKLRGQVHDGLNKYSIARFKTKARAESFKRDIQKIGVTDAFVAKTVDGQRVEVY